MRLLLDESVPARLRRSLPNHEVRTVVEMGWSGVKNGKLLALAASRYDAFITVDKNLGYQQNLAKLPLAVVVLDAVSIELPALLPLVAGSSWRFRDSSPVSTFVSTLQRSHERWNHENRDA